MKSRLDGESDHLLEQWWVGREALQDARHIRSAEAFAVVGIGLGYGAGCYVFLHDG